MPPSLLIDRAAAAARPDDNAVRAWAESQRVFVSSVIDGYSEYRGAAAAAIESLGALPVMFERFGGQDSDPHHAYLSEVRASTVYVGLLGARYGRPLPDRFAATHAEFRAAESGGIRTSVWIQSGVGREGPQQSFLEEVRAFQVTGSYADPDVLALGLTNRLRVIASEDLSPWMKLGHVVFRADEISEGSGSATIRATVRDTSVIAALRALDDRMRRQSLLFSYADQVLIAEPRGVVSTTRATRGVDVVLELAVGPPAAPTRISFNGVPWERLTEIAVAVSLFDQPNPFGIAAHVAQIANPFPDLKAAGVPEEALRPIARLLLSETLVTERGISRVTDVALAQPIAGRRRLRLQWQSPPAYSSQAPPAPSTAEGEIKW